MFYRFLFYLKLAILTEFHWINNGAEEFVYPSIYFLRGLFVILFKGGGVPLVLKIHYVNNLLISRLILYDMHFEVMFTWFQPFSHLCTVHYRYRSTEYVSRTAFIKNTVQEQNTIDLLCYEDLFFYNNLIS